jgi:hypothetical protein
VESEAVGERDYSSVYPQEAVAQEEIDPYGLPVDDLIQNRSDT